MRSQLADSATALPVDVYPGPQRRLAQGDYFGSTIQKQIGSTGMVESAYTMGTDLPEHTHEQDHLTLVLDGQYEEEIDGTRFQRQAEQVLYLPADVGHAERHRTHGRHFMIDPSHASLERLRRRRQHLRAPGVLPAEAKPVAMVLHKRFLNRDWVSPLATEVLLMDLLLHCHPARAASRRPPPFLRRAIAIVTKRFGESLTIAAVSREVGVPPRRLARTFKRWYGASLWQLLIERRLQFAFHELRHTTHPLNEIATTAGFFDQSHLGKIFRGAFGISPDAFRHTPNLETDLDPIARQKCVQFLLSKRTGST
jgi:AraC-like DNA-binding protein/quercetin dioxygenase-like cupin family protein